MAAKMSYATFLYIFEETPPFYTIVEVAVAYKLDIWIQPVIIATTTQSTKRISHNSILENCRDQFGMKHVRL